jgi:hypothetical protein
MTTDETPKDHVDERERRGADSPEESSLEENLKSRATWLRLLFMVIVALLLGLAGTVGGAVVVLQFFWVLFTGEPKPELSKLGRQIAAYYGEAIEFLTFNREDRPFPFDNEWPA